MSVHESMDPEVSWSGALDGRTLAPDGRGSPSLRLAPISDGGLTLLAVAHDRGKLENLARILRASIRVRELATAHSAHRALLSASRRLYDGVFLGVGMPELDWIESISVLNAFAVPPGVVVVAESDSQVAHAFRLGAVDYMIEPVSFERANQALERVEATVAWRQANGDRPSISRNQSDEAPGGNGLMVDSSRDGSTRLLVPRSILYLQAYGDYIRVFADSGRYLIRGRLADAAMTLRADGFLRVHRKYLANLQRATEIQMLQNGTALLRLENQRQVPVARRHVHELRQRLRADLRGVSMTWRAARQAHGIPVP